MTKGTCSVPNCNHPAFCRTWCRTHYNRWHRLGDVQADRPINLRSFKAAEHEICSVMGCGRAAFRRTWCKSHHQRWLDAGDVQPEVPIRVAAGPMGTVPCSVSGCPNPSRTRGWCHAHYRRFRKYGTPDPDRPILPAWDGVEDRFWAKVNKDGPVSIYRPDLGNCYLWVPPVNNSGYGSFNLGDRTVGAHVAGWMLSGGAPVTEGQEFDHLCRVRRCVRKSHLEPVPHKINVHRSMSVSALNLRKTHCKRGHEFNEANTYRDKHGRRCRACRRVGAKR